MTLSKEDDVETKLARLDDHMRKAEQRLDHDRVHGETDIGMEEQTKKETPDKSAGAV